MKNLLPLLLLFSISLQAQDLLHCGADEMRIETLQANPKIAEAVMERDAELEAFTKEYESSARGGQIYTITVVFHVIHKYGNENISREQILDGLDVLNATFRKQIPDTADIHPDFKPVHADCEIEFKLATKDPEGNCHSGINRIASTLTISGDHRVKELIHWDPSMYLNVYIVSNAAGLAGHAVWPADADTIPEWDGIVMGHNYMGRIGTSDQTRSVVFAHELGHYLNLHHIWGGNNVPEFYYLPVGQQANCNEDDLVSDTPNTIGWSSCNLNASSCGSPRDNVQNAMDYSYCNVMFTEGQKARMRACLNSSIANRNNLWTPANLAATGVLSEPAFCGADFEADKLNFCADNMDLITYSYTPYHAEPDSVLWSFQSGNPGVSNQHDPTVMYDAGGVYDVSLTLYSDGASYQITKEHYLWGPWTWTSYPFWDDFEGNVGLNAGNSWYERSFDTVNNWEVTELASYSPTHAMMVDNWDNNTITLDELFGLYVQTNQAPSMRLAFKYAFTGASEATNTSKLQVQISDFCGENWATRLTLSGQNLETAPNQESPFIPNQMQWVQESINIPTSYLDDGGFHYRFRFTSEGNNRLFLDDVNVDINPSVSETEVSWFQLFPNPANEQLTIVPSSPSANAIQVEVFAVDGKLISSNSVQGNSTIELDVSDMNSGMYFVSISSEEWSQTQRFIVN